MMRATRRPGPQSSATVSTNEADRRRLRQEPWPLEIFDEWSELTRERDGAEADAIAEQHERDRLGY